MSDKKCKLLVIVESPNKVKTISEILKKAGYTGATVVASVGHIMELKNGGTAFNSGISPDKNFKMNLAVADEKKKVVDEINKLAKTAEKVYLATDDDREGFLISWSVMKFCKLPAEKCFRAVMHEITPKAVVAAIENPIPFNDNIVDAGLARMMTDKLIGFGLSPLAKKYIGAKSIGRCQSVGLKLVSDRENEILNFIPELYYNLYLKFTKNNKELKAKYFGYKEEAVEKFCRQADVDAVINNCRGNQYTIEDIECVEHKESPKPPFCTATFQQEAASKLGLRVKDAMSCAQKLFEGIKVNGEHIGLITYLRTDSTELAPEFIPELRNFISATYGADKYSTPRKSKSKSTDQNGHEALRVVNLEMTPDKLATYISNELLIKVYRLIWQRTVATAMPNATIAEVIYTINNNGHKFKLSSKTLSDAGYRLVYDYTDNQIISCDEAFNIGEVLENTELEAVKRFTQPSARFTEASLVKELQKREIGRPSTFATIVETILSPSRGYAKLEEKCIVPTDRGMQLAEYCDRAFPTLINLNYTKDMEASLDKIASGDLALLDYMNSFYSNLKDIIDSTGEVGLTSSLEEKLCPECGSAMIVRRSRFGRLFYGCSAYPKCRGIISID
jgi:DNA topoisomerase-1